MLNIVYLDAREHLTKAPHDVSVDKKIILGRCKYFVSIQEVLADMFFSLGECDTKESNDQASLFTSLHKEICARLGPAVCEDQLGQKWDAGKENANTVA